MGDKIVNEQAEAMDEMNIMLASLGDEPITLMDNYERLSFEVHLNRAMLGRSLSESHSPRTRAWPKPNVIYQAHEGPKKRRHNGLGFRKVFERLIKPIFVRVGGRKEVPDAKDPKIWNVFSKSMRV